MKLKTYQQNTIETLANFLTELRKVGPKYAFMGITDTPYDAKFFGETPNICIKIPTGGGKTLVGCHAVDQIMNIALQNKMEKGKCLNIINKTPY